MSWWNPRTLIVVVAAALLSVASPASAQVYSNLMPDPYAFAALLGDLRAAGIEVDPAALVEAYRKSIVRWATEQAELRAALKQAVGTDVQVYRGPEEVDRAMRIIRRSRSSALGAEEALLNELALAAPESSRDGINRVREWRRTQQAIPKSVSIAAMSRFDDIGALVRRARLPDDVRQKVMEKLAASEASRASALERVQRAYEDGQRAAGEEVKAAGLVGKPRDLMSGKSSPEDQAMSTRMDRAAMIKGAYAAAVIEAEVKAFQSIADDLPRRERRAIIDQFAPGFIADQMQGGAMGLPLRARSPSEVARRVLAWKAMSDSQRSATRDALTKWLDADDALVLAGIEETAKQLRNADSPRDVMWNRAQAIQEERGKLALKSLAGVSKTSGADWLSDSSIPMPELDEAVLSDDDRDAIGIRMKWQPTPAPTSSLASRIDNMPIPLEDAAAKRLVDALVAEGGDRAKIEALVRDHRAAWEAEIRPTIETAQTLSRMLGPGDVEKLTDDEIQSNAEALRTARRDAFKLGDARDVAFAVALKEALGDRAAPLVDAFVASRRLDESLGQLSSALNRYGVEISRAGGSPCNVAVIIEEPSIPTATQRAAREALSNDWNSAIAAAKQIRTALIDASYGDSRSRIQSVAETLRNGGDQEAAPDAESPDFYARMAALILVLESWQQVEEGLVANVSGVASASDEAAIAVRTAVNRAKFRSAYHEVESLEKARAALESGAVFASRDELVRELKLCNEDLLALANRRAELFKPRIKLSALTGAARRYPGMDRAGEDIAILLIQMQLYSASTWLIDRMAPKEVVDASPDLRTALRFMNW